MSLVHEKNFFLHFLVSPSVLLNLNLTLTLHFNFICWNLKNLVVKLIHFFCLRLSGNSLKLNSHIIVRFRVRTRVTTSGLTISAFVRISRNKKLRVRMCVTTYQMFLQLRVRMCVTTYQMFLNILFIVLYENFIFLLYIQIVLGRIR